MLSKNNNLKKPRVMELRQIVPEIEPLENEKLTTSKHNLKQLKQTAEEIKKAVSAYETSEESQLDQVYIFEQMVS